MRPGGAEARLRPPTFVVTNKDASRATEYEVVRAAATLAEVENVTDGLTKRFSLTLQPGRYTLRCTGAEHEEGSLTVTGARASQALAPGAAARGRRLPGLPRARDRLAGDRRRGRCAPRWPRGDVAAAKRAYAKARVPYERVEPVAESFGDLDPRIDARANDVPKSQVDGLPPDRAQACGCRTRQRAPRSWPTAS